MSNTFYDINSWLVRKKKPIKIKANRNEKLPTILSIFVGKNDYAAE